MEVDERPMRIHAGGCHCGAGRFKVLLTEEIEVEDCNCSICPMTGFLHSIVSSSRFRLQAGEQRLTTHRFDTGIAQHRFCGVCGIESFYVPRSNADGIDVNLRCLDSQPKVVRVAPIDGRAWEQNAHRLAHKSAG